MHLPSAREIKVCDTTMPSPFRWWYPYALDSKWSLLTWSYPNHQDLWGNSCPERHCIDFVGVVANSLLGRTATIHHERAQHLDLLTRLRVNGFWWSWCSVAWSVECLWGQRTTGQPRPFRRQPFCDAQKRWIDLVMSRLLYIPPCSTNSSTWSLRRTGQVKLLWDNSSRGISHLLGRVCQTGTAESDELVWHIFDVSYRFPW